MPDGRLVPRPIPSREATASFSVPSEQAQILKYAIGNTDPGEFHAKLHAAVANLHHTDQEKLLEVLQKAGLVLHNARTAVHDGELRHCVRCHQNYHERDNGLFACRLSHGAPRAVVSKTGEHVGNQYVCCKKTWAVNVPLPAYCFSRHSTRPEFAFDDGIERSCAQGGCGRR